MKNFIVAAFMCLMLMTSGCSVLSGSRNQLFNGADLVAVSNDRGLIGNEAASASYAVAPITTNGQAVDVVALKGENGFAIKAAAIIPFNKVLESMPRTVSEALALCVADSADLKLNLDARTNDVVWVAKTDGSIHSLFITLSKPGLVLNTDVDLIVHFTFMDHKLVRVDQRQIMAWSRASGLMPAAPVTPTPAPVVAPTVPAAPSPGLTQAEKPAPVAPLAASVAKPAADPVATAPSAPTPVAAPAPSTGLGTVASVEPVRAPSQPVVVARGPSPIPAAPSE